MSNENVIEIRDLTFAWPGGPPLLDIGELEVARGSRVFVHGPSGCGKSTLLNLLGGVVSPRSGSLRVLGTDLAGMRPAARDRFRADHVGFIFQQFNLVPYLDVIDNVLLPARFSPARRERIARLGGTLREAALALLDALGLADLARRRPVAELSVGQQQRVAAARALLGEPELVIADEPTSALDADRRGAFLSLLDAACRRGGASLVFVSHDRALGAGFDRRIELPGLNRAAGDAK